jgi:rod shape-determining protein MreD
MRLKNLLPLLTGIILLFFQVHPLLPMGRSGIRPDVLLIYVMFIGINYNIYKGSIFCFFLGYSFEIFSGVNSGLISLIYLSVFIVIKLLQKFLNFDTIFELLLLFLICFFVKFIIVFFSFYIFYEYSFVILIKLFLKEIIYTLSLYPLVFFLIKKIYYYQNITNEENKIPNNATKL